MIKKISCILFCTKTTFDLCKDNIRLLDTKISVMENERGRERERERKRERESERKERGREREREESTESTE